MYDCSSLLCQNMWCDWHIIACQLRDWLMDWLMHVCWQWLTVWLESEQSMGVDQSMLSSAPLKSQRDEDIPYTSCSISKPIGSGSNSRWFVIVDVVELISVMLCSLPVFISTVTISKFWFSIDFDSIFSPKWRFRFDSILVTPTLNHSRQNSVTTDAGRSSSKRFIAFIKPAGVC